MTVFTEYPKEKKFSFNITAKDMLQEMTPPLGAEQMHPLFKKYGYTYSGICDGWEWYDGEIPDEDIWHMAALCNLYWCNSYEYWYNKLQFEEYKQHVKDCIKKDSRFEATLDRLEKSQKEAEQERMGWYSVKDGQWVKDT